MPVVAEKFASEDAKKKEEVEIGNQADALAYSTEKALKDYGDKVSQTERADIEAKLTDLRTSIKDKNIDKIKKGMDELSKASHKLAEEVYKQASAKQQQAGGAGAGQAGAQSAGSEQPQEEPQSEAKPKDDIIDADFKEEK